MKKIDKFTYNLIILSVSIFLIEFIFKLISNQNIFDIATIRSIISSIIISLIVSYIETFISDKTISKINIILVSIFAIYSLVQVGFNNYIGVYISFNVSSQAGAVLSYIFEFFKSFYWYYYFLLFPILLIITYYILLKKEVIKLNFKLENDKIKNIFALASFSLLFCFSYYVTINLDLFQNKLQTISNKDLFKNPTNPSIAIRQFGPIVYGFLDIKNLFINGNDPVVKNELHYNQNESTKINDEDWLTLIEKEENTVLNYLNEYYINNKYTNDNSYTGLFEDKNLIVIMMESVNDIFINEDLYPNFYKLLSEGYNFTNNYSPRNSCATGNNELSGMIGLYSIYNKCTANTYSTNLYPESIFNLFNYKGYKTTSMHNYTERYYARREIHTNMGSKKYYDVDDLKLSYNIPGEEWSSDEDFMKEVVKILNNYKENERFMTWLTTVTSHQPYGKSIYGDKYLSLLEDSKYDNYNLKLKRYMSKLKVLDEGLGVLINGLEKQGKLDDTVIVLFGDHYPYGLPTSVLQEAIPYNISEKYESERVPFVIWSNDVEATTFRQYTTYVNIVPTIANLFNLEYDSRYYTGEDLFDSSYQSIAIYADGSWKNEYAFYDASNTSITYYTDFKYSIDEIIKINEMVSNKIKYSNLAIQHDYFNYLYENIEK